MGHWTNNHLGIGQKLWNPLPVCSMESMANGSLDRHLWIVPREQLPQTSLIIGDLPEFLISFVEPHSRLEHSNPKKNPDKIEKQNSTNIVVNHVFIFLVGYYLLHYWIDCGSSPPNGMTLATNLSSGHPRLVRFTYCRHWLVIIVTIEIAIRTRMIPSSKKQRG